MPLLGTHSSKVKTCHNRKTSGQHHWLRACYRDTGIAVTRFFDYGLVASVTSHYPRRELWRLHSQGHPRKHTYLEIKLMLSFLKEVKNHYTYMSTHTHMHTAIAERTHSCMHIHINTHTDMGQLHFTKSQAVS